MENILIELKEVWKSYTMGKNQVHALKGVSLQVKKGEFLAIVGKSGSGKSTLMNLIGCLDLPTKGHVFLVSKDIARMKESELAQIRGKKIGFIFQQFHLIPTLTALENVMLPGQFQDQDTERLEKKGEELLAFVDMQSRIFHKATELSGGQMQRVAIARSLINDPEIILADEPTGALDSTTGTQVLQLLKDLHEKKGKCIIIVTHDPSIAEHAQRVIELKDGEILREYAPRRKT